MSGPVIQLHSLLVRHGRSCRLCSANGSITEAEVSRANCPIKVYLRSSTKKSTRKTPKKRKSGKAAVSEEEQEEEEEEEDQDDEEEEEEKNLLLPGDIKDEDEEMGKQPAGAPVLDGPVKTEEEKVLWKNFGENKKGQMHGL